MFPTECEITFACEPEKADLFLTFPTQRFISLKGSLVSINLIGIWLTLSPVIPGE